MNSRVWQVAAIVVALAGAAVGLEYVAPISPAVVGETVRLPLCESLNLEVPELLPMPSSTALGGEVAEAVGFEGLAVAVTLAALPWHEAISGVEGSVAVDAPAYAMLQGVATELRVSPFLGPVEVWEEGPLGVLAQEALAALAAGDVLGYQAKAADYWLGLERAFKRRSMHR